MSHMRLWLAAALAVPGCAQAFDLTPDNTRYLSDPSFLPLAGQVHGETSYGYSNTQEDKVLPNGTVSPHYAARENTVSQTLGYGITDRLSVRVAESYDVRREKETYPTGTYDYRRDGFVDPSFGVTFRAFEQGDHPVSVDLSAGYAPDVLANKAAYASNAGSPTTTGTVASGGQSGSLGLAISREMKSLTLYGYANTTYTGQRKEQMQFGNTPYEYSSNWGYALGLDSQARLTDRWFVNAGAGVSGRTGAYVSNASLNTAYRASDQPSTSVYIGPGYQVIPNRLVLSVNYQRDSFGDESMEAASGSLGTWKNMSEDHYVVHARFLFF